jgi:hypothetical protein
MGRDDADDRSLPIRARERQTVLNIRLHGAEKRVSFVAVEELDGNGVLAAQHRGMQPVHAVDYLHRRTMYENRR